MFVLFDFLIFMTSHYRLSVSDLRIILHFPSHTPSHTTRFMVHVVVVVLQ